MRNRRRYWEHSSLLAIGITLATILGGATPSRAQIDPSQRQRIAPRLFPRSLQAEKKSLDLKRSARSFESAAPSSQNELSRAPADDVLTITKGLSGLTFKESGDSVPPDTHIAAGPAHIVEVTNSTIAFYDRIKGKRLFVRDLSLFFAPVGAGPFVFDPQVSFDELSGRFILAVLDVDDASASGYLLYAVSDSANPLDGFSEMHRLSVTEIGTHGETLVPDFPRLGWNADTHVITVNMFGVTSQEFDHVSVITIDKNSVLDGHSGTFYFFRANRDSSHFTLVPALMHDSLSGGPMWFVEEAGFVNGTAIRVVKMTDALSPTPTFTDTDLPVSDYEIPPNADQPGSGFFGLIQTNDSSILSVAWRQNKLFATHTVGIPSTREAHARWYEINTAGSTPSLLQEGTINPGAGVHTYYPSIEIAANGDIGMTYMQSSSLQFMSMYVTGRTPTDPVGQMRAPILAKAGVATYAAFDCAVGKIFDDDCRAGDYSGISLDPNFANMFCAANEYATSGRSNNWGTWIACFSIGAPDLALVTIKTPATVRAATPAVAAVQVTIQNRGDRSEAIALTDLGNGVTTGLVRLNVSDVDDDGEACQPAVVTLDGTRNGSLFSSGSQTLAPKRTLTINYLVTLHCSGAVPANKSDSSRGDYAFSASVHHEVLDGSADIHEEDDVCPRDALPGLTDLLPGPKGTKDKGCGAKKPDRTLGAPIVTDVIP